MFATITRVARAGAISTVDEPNHLAWRTLGAAWAIWICGWVLGMSQWYWGSLLVVSALWATTAAVDRLRRFDAMSITVASLLRAFLLGLGFIWAPRAIVAPAADLALWTADMVTAAAAHMLAPWAVRDAGTHEFWRWWNDLKVAAASGGGLIVAVVVLSAVGDVAGYATTEDLFVGTLAGAAFCVIPTTLSLRAA